MTEPGGFGRSGESLAFGQASTGGAFRSPACSDQTELADCVTLGDEFGYRFVDAST